MWSQSLVVKTLFGSNIVSAFCVRYVIRWSCGKSLVLPMASLRPFASTIGFFYLSMSSISLCLAGLSKFQNSLTSFSYFKQESSIEFYIDGLTYPRDISAIEDLTEGTFDSGAVRGSFVSCLYACCIELYLSLSTFVHACS